MEYCEGLADSAQHQPAAAARSEAEGTSIRSSLGSSFGNAPLQRFDWQTHIDQSPRVVTQRRSMQTLLGGTVQRRGKDSQGGLPYPLKTGIESLSGMDLGDVRVHRNSGKPAQLNALAYAQGNDIHLGPGQERHLPHEAWHVVQQRQGRVRETLQTAGVGVNDDAGLEREADVMGARAWAAGASKPHGQALLSSRQPAMGASVQRTAVPVVQRYVTFDALQEHEVLIGQQGKAGYESIDALVDALFGNLEKKPQVLHVLGPYLGNESHICFDSFESAVSWVMTEGASPKAAVAEKPQEPKDQPQIVWAFRMEGAPKSPKQLSDVQKNVTPDAAFEAAIAPLAEELDGYEEQVELLRGQWGAIATKDKKKRAQEVAKLSKKMVRSLPGVKQILEQAYSNKDVFDHQVEQGQAFASRVYLDGSNMIPATKASGTVTGLSSWINFSVGSADHASYFATTFGDKGGIVVRFALDKALWRQWKTHKSGPQESGIGPRPANMTTTLNDVGQPGVKYEMQEGHEFFQQVVVKSIPAQVTPLAKNATAVWKPSGAELARTVERLAKAQGKLEQELAGIDSSSGNFEAERAQNETAKLQLGKEWAPGALDGLKDLYTAMSLTKNALHSVRRKQAEVQDK